VARTSGGMQASLAMSLPGTPVNPDPDRSIRRHVTHEERARLVEGALHDPTILCLCTGNAARSPIAAVLLADALGGANVRSAGTHAIEGQPVSWRTRFALEVVRPDLLTRITGHRSHQLTRRDVDSADLIVCMASEHVGYVRREFPDAVARTATLARLARFLPPGHLASLGARVGEMGLATVELEGWEEIEDPAGGEVDDFVRCATRIDELAREAAYRMAMPHLL